MNAPVKFDVIASAAYKPRDFVTQPLQWLDRVTFNTPDVGVLAGYVSVIRQHLGNGERFAWGELDNELAGNSVACRWRTSSVAMMRGLGAAMRPSMVRHSVFSWLTIAATWPMSCGQPKRLQPDFNAMAASNEVPSGE